MEPVNEFRKKPDSEIQVSRFWPGLYNFHAQVTLHEANQEESTTEVQIPLSRSVWNLPRSPAPHGSLSCVIFLSPPFAFPFSAEKEALEIFTQLHCTALFSHWDWTSCLWKPWSSLHKNIFSCLRTLNVPMRSAQHRTTYSVRKAPGWPQLSCGTRQRVLGGWTWKCDREGLSE